MELSPNLRHEIRHTKFLEGEFGACLRRVVQFTREFKMAAVKRLQSGIPVGRVARELEVNSNQLHRWKTAI